MARFWLQLACTAAAYAFVLPPTPTKAATRREAVADLLPDNVVNSLSEEQLALLYNAPDAVAGALGAEAAALGEFAGKASEAFATKVVPALKEGGDALKPAVEAALSTGASSASGAFAAVVYVRVVVAVRAWRPNAANAPCAPSPALVPAVPPGGVTTLVLCLEDSAATRAVWPHAFKLRDTVPLGGDGAVLFRGQTYLVHCGSVEVRAVRCPLGGGG